VNKKVLAALGSGLDVVLCIGENERDSDGAYLNVIRTELDIALRGVLPRDLFKIAVAYEPVFAIGKSAAEAMNGEQVQEMVIFIRKLFTERFNRSRADAMPILYGGSVDDTNAGNIYTLGTVDGFLLGRASLDPVIVQQIIKLTS
jgi:triosephosphate isomerase